MYDQEKIKKMKNHELAMEAYFYAYNHKFPSLEVCTMNV